MGADTGGGDGGTRPPSLKQEGDVPPEIAFFFRNNYFLDFFQDFQNKVTKSEEKSDFGGRWV